MPELMISPEQRDRLGEIGRLLRSARDLYWTVWNDGLATPAPGSQAETDVTKPQTCYGSAEPWPDDFAREPRGLAVNWTYQAANNLAGLGILFEAGEFMESPVTLARAAVEFMTRATWLLDPTVGHRARCARQWLTELKTFDSKVAAIKYRMPDWENSDVRRDTKAKRKALKAWLGKIFVSDAMDKEYPVLEGQAYLNFTEVTDHWAKANGIDAQGGAIYELLALRAHPQGFNSTADQFVPIGSGEADRQVAFIELENIGRLVAQMFYSAMINLVQYHGYDASAVEKWADQIATVFPDAFETT